MGRDRIIDRIPSAVDYDGAAKSIVVRRVEPDQTLRPVMLAGIVIARKESALLEAFEPKALENRSRKPICPGSDPEPCATSNREALPLTTARRCRRGPEDGAVISPSPGGLA